MSENKLSKDFTSSFKKKTNQGHQADSGKKTRLPEKKTSFLQHQWQINMELKNGGLDQRIFLFDWMIFRFQSLIFQGVTGF